MPVPMARYITFFLIGIHFMQSWTALKGMDLQQKEKLIRKAD